MKNLEKYGDRKMFKKTKLKITAIVSMIVGLAVVGIPVWIKSLFQFKNGIDMDIDENDINSSLFN